MRRSRVPRRRSGDARALAESCGLIGQSPVFRTLITDLDDLAHTRETVLLLGEVGTGKSQLAKFVHAASGRTGAFIAVNCPSIVESLADSVLFGHRAGTFTGATGRHVGLFEAADGGTLFLDEIGDLSPVNQGRLLQVLQDRAIRPIGERNLKPIDVRVIAATNLDLDERCAERQFRDDLLSRLNRFPVTVPPLRERGRDGVLIARHVVKHHPSLQDRQPLRLTACAEDWIWRWPWRHNIRGLETTTIRAGIKARRHRIDAELIDHVALRAPTLPGTALTVAVPAPMVEPIGLPPRVVVELPHRQAALALELARGRPYGIAPRDLVAAGVSESTAQRVLELMVEAGLLRHNGRFGKAVRYLVA